MKRKDLLLALGVVIIWGANFTVIKLGVGGMPSMLLVALRYIFTFFPAILFVKKPRTQWKYILLYGTFVGVGQFSLLFYAMANGMPAGLSSILLQLQAFISPILGYFLLKENLRLKQIIGFAIAAIGLFFIGLDSVGTNINAIPILSIGLTVMGALFWSISNIVAKVASQESVDRGEKLDMFGLVVWSSLVPPIPLLGLALLFDPPQVLIHSIISLNSTSIFAVIYLAFGATLFGYGVWSSLVSSYPLSKVAPLSLLVPITGFLTARIVLSEELSAMQWIGVSIILLGLFVTNIDFKQFRDKIFRKDNVKEEHNRMEVK